MTSTRVLLLLLVACGPASTPPAEPTPPPAPDPGPAPAPTPTPPPTPPPAIKKYDARAFFDTVAIGGTSFSHDESKILIHTNATGVFNVYAHPPEKGAPIQQLTTSTTDSTFAVSWFPKDDRFLFTSDSGGNENDHLFVMDAGKPRDLTPGAKVKAQFLDFTADGSAFFVITNERDPKAFDVYRYATGDYRRTRVFENKGTWSVEDVSRDGRWLAVRQIVSNTDANIFRVDLKKKGAKPELITRHTGEAEHVVLGFTPDNRSLWYGTHANGDFLQAWSYDMVTGKHRPEIQAPWSVMFVSFSDGGRYRLSATNEDARTVLTVVEQKTGKPVALPKLPEGDITAARFSPSEKTLAFYVSGDRSPPNLYVLSMETGKYVQLTDTLSKEIEPSYLVDGKVVRYPSFDKLEIPAILYRPIGATPERPAPAVVWVHGGPGGQSRLGYSAMLQHVVNHGYAVLSVNNRGSSGYGKKFFHMDDKRHGDVDLKDVIAGRAYLASLPWVDGKRVAIAGGSYGGYMTVAALAFAPDAFDAGIDIFGVTNWIRTLESIPPYWASFRDSLYSEMGDPAKERERLTAISPLFHAANIKKPLLVVQGANDPRVLKVESDEIVAAVRKNGVPVEYLIFPDEGHGFEKKTNQIAASDAYVKFLDHHLRK